MIQVRKSDDQGFYYALDIDELGNERIIAQNDSLAELRKHPEVLSNQGFVLESKTRGSKSPIAEIE